MTYSVKDLQEHFGVGEHTVLAWIKSGELRALSVARKPGGKPKWRVTQESLVSFKHQRGTAPTTEAAKAAVKNVHDAFILERWNHGRVWGSTFEVPLR